MTVQDQISCTPLLAASGEGHLELVQILLENGAKVTETDKLGWTALHKASGARNADLAQFFLKNGAKVAAQDKGVHSSTQGTVHGRH